MAAAAVVAAVGTGAAIAGTSAGTDDRADTATGADERSDADGVADGTGSTAERSTSTALERLTPDEAFAQAALRLETAGSFAYTGTSQATDVSPVRPGLWLAVELTVFGEVDLAEGRMHEVAVVPSGRASETVTDGTTVWGRLAPSGEDLAAEAYQTVGQSDAEEGDAPRRLGAALLPTWLEASIDRQRLPPDGTGQQTFRATIPADVLGEVETGRDPVAAELVLTVDAGGDPVHVEVTTDPDGPPLHLVLDLARLGEPLVITVPGDEPTDAPTSDAPPID